MRLSLGFTTVAVVGGVLAGCWMNRPAASAANGGGQEPKSGKTYKSAEEFQPGALPYKDVRLILSGTEVPAKMTRSVEGKKIEFDIRVHDASFEEELYLDDATGFRFAGLTGESFQPPIPLVTYPLTAGDTWSWAGMHSLGPTVKPAKATLASSMDRLNLATGLADCVLVVANLTVDTGGGGKSVRPLKFWFEPGKGIVKREFAYSSTREPRTPSKAEP